MKARLFSAAAFFALAAFLSFATPGLAQEVASVFSFGNGAGTIAPASTRYLAAFDGGASTSDFFRIVIPRAGNLRNLYWSAPASSLTGANNTITVLKNGVATPLAVTWNAATRAGSNISHSEPVVAGDVISVRIQLSAGSGTITRPTVSFELLVPGGSQWITSGSNIYYSAGNVGIGTGTGGLMGRLTIVGGADIQGTLRLENPSKGEYNSHVHFGDTGDWYIRSASPAGKVLIQDIAGNVGIGTPDPFGKLHVNGDIALGQGDETGRGIIRFSLKGVLVLGGGLSDSGGRIALYGHQHATNPAQISFLTSNTVRMMIDNAGNVGIGTPTPQSLLAVNGRITAKEVMVTLGGWSDFVFDENYQLPSLEEVERHIKEKKHLPDIPSEQEVMASGVNLGEMQAKLLQKVEELTLYVIELKKENQRLQQQFTKLEKASK